MRGSGKRVLSSFLAVVLVGCYWQRYPELTRTHVELLLQYARRLDDVLRDRGELRSRDLTELRYPYDRARDFARIVRSRMQDRSSFRSFERFLDRYRELLEAIDRDRAESRHDEIARIVRSLDADGEAVLDALRSESS
jgi:hypothetical protein